MQEVRVLGLSSLGLNSNGSCGLGHLSNLSSDRSDTAVFAGETWVAEALAIRALAVAAAPLGALHLLIAASASVARVALAGSLLEMEEAVRPAALLCGISGEHGSSSVRASCLTDDGGIGAGHTAVSIGALDHLGDVLHHLGVLSAQTTHGVGVLTLANAHLHCGVNGAVFARVLGVAIAGTLVADTVAGAVLVFSTASRAGGSPGAVLTLIVRLAVALAVDAQTAVRAGVGALGGSATVLAGEARVAEALAVLADTVVVAISSAFGCVGAVSTTKSWVAEALAELACAMLGAVAGAVVCFLGPHDYSTVLALVARLAQALPVEADATSRALVWALLAVGACLASVSWVAVALGVNADTLVVAVVLARGLLSSGAVTATEAGVAITFGTLAQAVTTAVARAALVLAAVSTDVAWVAIALSVEAETLGVAVIRAVSCTTAVLTIRARVAKALAVGTFATA